MFPRPECSITTPAGVLAEAREGNLLTEGDRTLSPRSQSTRFQPHSERSPDCAWGGAGSDGGTTGNPYLLQNNPGGSVVAPRALQGRQEGRASRSLCSLLITLRIWEARDAPISQTWRQRPLLVDHTEADRENKTSFQRKACAFSTEPNQLPPVRKRPDQWPNSWHIARQPRRAPHTVPSPAGLRPRK